MTLGLGIGGLLLGGAGTLMQAGAQRDQSNADAAQARLNQELANRQATDALQRGGVESGRIRSEGTKVIAEQRTGYAGNGVDVGSGSTLDTYGETRMASELDALTAKNNAAREAWGYQVQGSQFGKEAELAKQRGDNAVAGTLLGGAGNAIGGGIDLAAKYRKFNPAAVPTAPYYVSRG